jgi:hypothetical protein
MWSGYSWALSYSGHGAKLVRHKQTKTMRRRDAEQLKKGIEASKARQITRPIYFILPITITVQHPDRSDDTAAPDVAAANVKEDVRKAYSLNIEIIRGGGL